MPEVFIRRTTIVPPWAANSARMKFINWMGNRRGAGKVIAVFGEAELVKSADGRFELRGGTRADYIAAQEWISLFLHEAVCTFRPAPLPRPWWMARAA